MADNTDHETTTDEAAPVAAPSPMDAIRASILPTYTANLEALKVIDVRLAESAGTQAKRVKAATEKVVASAPVLDDEVLIGSMPTVLARIGAVSNPVTALVALDGFLDDLKAQREDLTEKVRILVNEDLKATSAGSDDATALKAQRATLVVNTKAMATILDGNAEGSHTVAIPKAPHGSGGTSSTTRVKRSAGRYYRLVNGQRAFYAADDLGYMAFAHGVTAEDLKAILAEAGTTDLAAPFETTVTIHGVKAPKAEKTTTVTIGLEVEAKEEAK